MKVNKAQIFNPKPATRPANPLRLSGKAKRVAETLQRQVENSIGDPVAQKTAGKPYSVDITA